jgi:glycosyltransferase involved in cell wall biosynthesis
MTLAQETVDDVVRREFCRPPDQAMIALAGSPDVGRLIVCDPWRSGPVDVARGRGIRPVRTLEVGGRRVDRVSPHRWRRADPLDVPSLEVAFRRYARRVGAAAGLSAAHPAALVAYNPFVAAFAEDEWITRRVYVGRDDFANGPRRKAWSAAYLEAYRRIAARCDDVFVVSDELGARVAPGLARTLPNGVDAARWAPGGRRSAWNDRGPYAVYAGTVEGRVDETLIGEVLTVLPEVVVAGPVEDEDLRRRMAALGRVTFVGVLGQDDLVDVVTSAVVGLVPHHDTPMTRAMSPLKMYEYLAAGLPVVATDLPPVAEGGDRVLRCASREDWAPAVRRALELGRLDDAGRREVLARVGWEKRLRPLVEAATGLAPAAALAAR